MTWENRDIYVVKLANTPKFSRLCDIVTFLRLLKLFFGNILVDMVVGYTKLYSHREKTGISFEITYEKIRLFLSTLLLSVISFQVVKYIGRRPPILLYKQGLIQCLVIRSSVFFGISIFETTNNLINQTNFRSSLGDYEIFEVLFQ